MSSQATVGEFSFSKDKCANGTTHFRVASEQCDEASRLRANHPEQPASDR